MSKIFYDHLVVLEEVDVVIRQSSEIPEEREELWQLVDEIVHHRILAKILTHLPHDHHEEFLTKFHQAPHDDGLLDFLNEKIEGEFEELIKSELELVSKEILREIVGSKKK